MVEPKISQAGVVTYRVLPPDEWERLKPIYEENNDTLPPVDGNFAIVAEIYGEIIGLTGINTVVHAGPRWVHKRWRRMGIALQMGRLAEEFMKSFELTGYLMFPSNPISEALAERLGLERMPWSVYARKF
jgi:RimJ/RimL family protein N-acetyltransferase